VKFRWLIRKIYLDPPENFFPVKKEGRKERGREKK